MGDDKNEQRPADKPSKKPLPQQKSPWSKQKFGESGGNRPQSGSK
ncbi:hypothetical protein [Demequina sp. NBRC 110055]|nr:hypothetical protein [Demequina sp. NBRC 110055]